MRLWHIDLIPFLPRQQLLSQWRECVCIAKNLAEKGTPNHVLVNRILEYPTFNMEIYCDKVVEEMRKRGYKVSETTWTKLADYLLSWGFLRLSKPYDYSADSDHVMIFEDWHNRRYLDQCFYNLQEKHDCGAITDDEWQKLEEGYRKASEENE